MVQFFIKELEKVGTKKDERNFNQIEHLEKEKNDILQNNQELTNAIDKLRLINQVNFVVVDKSINIFFFLNDCIF